MKTIVSVKAAQKLIKQNTGRLFPRDRFYFEGKITQFPVRFCLYRVQSKRGFLSIENSATSPLFWSQAASIGMMSQVIDKKINLTICFTGYRDERITGLQLI